MHSGSKTSKDFDIPNELSRPISTSSTYSQKIRLDGKKAPDNSKSESDKQNSKPKKKSGLKIFLHFIVKNFGILILVILYLIGGAFLFKILEQHNEIQTCQQGEGEWNKLRISYRSKLFNYIYFNTTSNPWLPVDNATIAAGLYTVKDGPYEYNPKLTTWLLEFRDSILKLRNDQRYSGQDCEKQSAWTYFSALLFTITVLTTLGYGHVTPTTWEGQIVCICYATLGIPLFVMSTVKISSLLGELFRLLYGNVFCYVCNKSKRKSKKLTKNENNENKTEIEQNYDIYDEKIKNVNIIDEDEDDQENEEDKDNVTVPLVLVLSAYFGYLALGGYLFSSIETSWNMREGCYFSFVSLSTIGFGDYVPGINKVLAGDEGEGGKNLLIACVYIYIGLAILAMCFQLMQDEVVEKINLILEKLGFSKKSDPNAKVEFINDASANSNEKEDIKRSNSSNDMNVRQATVISVKPRNESSC